MRISRRKTIAFIIIVSTLIGSLYGGYLERNNSRPSGVMSVLTYPYRAARWIKYNEPVDIPPLPVDSASYFYGSRIQRTMSLLHSSNESVHHKVRILFYGQSIIQGFNSERVIEKLREKYPEAIIEYDNRAIGGFEAPSLVRTAVHDLYPYYPDLLIFHVYGGNEYGELERILYNVRKYTTSEIMLFNHHYRWEEDSVQFVVRTKKDEVESVNLTFLAQKYGCELVDVRTDWANYISAHPSIEIRNLMGDEVHSDVHPNDKGKKLYELLLMRHFKFNPIAVESNNRGWFNEIRSFDMRRYAEEAKDEVEITGNFSNNETGVILDSAILSMEFTGNRVEIFIPELNQDIRSSLSVMIDNKPPSEISDLYYITRPSEVFGEKTIRPALKRVSVGQDPLEEKWTLTITKIDRLSQYLEFKIRGERTGFDGIGNNKSIFTSNSGRIQIDPMDFFIFEGEEINKNKTPVGFEIHWEVKGNFLNELELDSDSHSFLVAQGLKNGTHTLTLIHDGKRDGFPIKSIQVHRPPLN